MSEIDGLKAALAGIEIEDNPAIVKQKSRDFFWYSPVLKRQLDHVVGDIVVTPKDQDELIRVLRESFARNLPVTMRGGGTGNYGQAMPLSGGVVLNMLKFDKVLSITPGRVRAQTGAIVHALCEETRRHSRQELRLWPSTDKTASIGGFIAGGSGGVGSVKWGGLRDHGNILGLRVVTLEAEPRVLDITDEEIHKISHAYGTNGVITEVEMPLTAAYDWIDVIVDYPDLMAAARGANVFGNLDGVDLKELAVIAAPYPHTYFPRHRGYLSADRDIVVSMVAPHSIEAFVTVARQTGGRVAFRSDELSADALKGLPPAYELCWNHTTLRGLRVDPSITYLQIMFAPPNHLELVERTTALFDPAEVTVHLEFARFEGRLMCFGLHLVRFTTEERLDEITRILEDNGCVVFNAHRFTLEEGGMKQSDPVQLAFKKQADPKGLFNPGKMIAWDDPNYDFKSDRIYLFQGMQPAPVED